MISKNIPFVLVSLILLSSSVMSQCTVSVKFSKNGNKIKILAVISDKAEKLNSDKFTNLENASQVQLPALGVKGEFTGELKKFDATDICFVDEKGDNVFCGTNFKNIGDNFPYVVSQHIGFHYCKFVKTGDEFVAMLVSKDKIMIQANQILL